MGIVKTPSFNMAQQLYWRSCAMATCMSVSQTRKDQRHLERQAGPFPFLCASNSGSSFKIFSFSLVELTLDVPSSSC